jgi:hypothetical protein
MLAGDRMDIEAYDFGSITIGGKTYSRDLKIIDGKVIPNWWRLEGHLLLSADLEDVFEARPDTLVVGTGDPGLLKVSAEVRSRLAELGIDLVVEPTRRACNAFNRLSRDRNTAFAAHLTC